MRSPERALHHFVKRSVQGSRRLVRLYLSRRVDEPAGLLRVVGVLWGARLVCWHGEEVSMTGAPFKETPPSDERFERLMQEVREGYRPSLRPSIAEFEEWLADRPRRLASLPIVRSSDKGTPSYRGRASPATLPQWLIRIGRRVLRSVQTLGSLPGWSGNPRIASGEAGVIPPPQTPSKAGGDRG
jgi:hypothetical protein